MAGTEKILRLIEAPPRGPVEFQPRGLPGFSRLEEPKGGRERPGKYRGPGRGGIVTTTPNLASFQIGMAGRLWGVVLIFNRPPRQSRSAAPALGDRSEAAGRSTKDQNGIKRLPNGAVWSKKRLKLRLKTEIPV